MKRTNSQVVSIVAVFILVVAALYGAPEDGPIADSTSHAANVHRYGAIGDGTADDTSAIRKAVQAGVGEVRFSKGVYRITETITIDLDRVGPTSIVGDAAARIVMAGPGPAFRFVGTHEGTAGPSTFQQNVWLRQRTPTVAGIEIVGEHPEACGIEATGTMQLTVTRVVIRQALHAIHLVRRNRNVILSQCHLYHNRGIGVFLDRLNLHQINIVNCHISYNEGGGVVAKGSEIRNLQVGTCDIEGNMGGPESEPTANILLDSTGSSVGEVAIVGCTIQHSHDAPGSANIRINGHSNPRAFTDEMRSGNIVIADNVLSDVQVNIELRNTRGVTITGNTFWKGYQHNLLITGSDNVVVANNVFDRNPRYHYGDGAQARLGLVFLECRDCTVNGNHVKGTGDVPAAIVVRQCRRFNITNCTILDGTNCGLLLEDVSDSRVSDCLIRDDRGGENSGLSLRIRGGRGNMVVDNYLGSGHAIQPGAAHVEGNYAGE